MKSLRSMSLVGLASWALFILGAPAGAVPQ
jgi:hypothetical protein